MHESNKFVSRRKVKSVKIKVGVERETGSARGGEGERWNCIDTDRESSGYSNVCVCVSVSLIAWWPRTLATRTQPAKTFKSNGGN